MTQTFNFSSQSHRVTLFSILILGFQVVKSSIQFKVEQDSNQHVLNLDMTSFYGAYSSIGSLFLFSLFFSLPCGLLCASLANNKGYSPWRWFAGGVLFDIIGLIAAAGLPNKFLRNQLREALTNKYQTILMKNMKNLYILVAVKH